VRATFELQLPSRRLKLGNKTMIMAVLNVTPDSFFDGGRHFHMQDAIDGGLRLEDEGADILDIGGESTRPPNSQLLPLSEELNRILPVIEGLKKRLTIPISIDTYKSGVAREALSAGAEIINDIGGLRFDPSLAQVVAHSRAGLVLMHSRGKPGAIHGLFRLKYPLKSVLQSLKLRIKLALTQGISLQQLIVDPGLGFGKQSEDNLTILGRLETLSELRLPVLVGASRKSFLGEVLGLPVRERLYGSLAAAAVAVMKGSHILRVHDVRETLQVVKVCDAILACGSP
jgi:dihydropteroate synthase